MKLSDLRHGDIILYEKSKRANLFVRGIRLITGSQFTHVGMVIKDTETNYNLGCIIFIEQLAARTISIGEIYTTESAEVLHVVRPNFGKPAALSKEFARHKTYGYLCILDALINHFIGLFNDNYTYRQFVGQWSKNITCSGLVAELLNTSNYMYFRIPQAVEPNWFIRETNKFTYLGILDVT